MWTKVMREWGFGAGAFVLAAAAYAMHFSDQGEKQAKRTIWADQIIVGEDPKNRVTIVPGSITVSGQSREVGNRTAISGHTEIKGLSLVQAYNGSRVIETENPEVVRIKSVSGLANLGVGGLYIVGKGEEILLAPEGLKFRIRNVQVTLEATSDRVRLLDADGKVIWESAK